MFTKRCPENRVVKNDLVILYKTEAVSYTESGTSGTYYKYTRTATKKYSYVDMTYEGAKNAADELVTIYTRQTASLRKRTSGQTAPSVVVFGNLTSKIECSRGSGDVWSVDVDVQEEDVRASATLLADPSTLFSAENLRDYDTQDDVVLQILGTSYDATNDYLLIRTSNNMTDAQRATTVIQMRASSAATTWEQIGGLVWIDEDKVLLHRDDIVLSTTQIMLEYGETTSNVFTVSSTVPCVRITSAQCYEDGSSGSILVNTDGDDFSYLADMDIYMDSSDTNMTKYTGAKTYMTWEDGLCTIANGAPILQVMKDATRIMLIDATHASTNVTIGKLEAYHIEIERVFAVLEDGAKKGIVYVAVDSTAVTTVEAATSAIFYYSDDGETFASFECYGTFFEYTHSYAWPCDAEKTALHPISTIIAYDYISAHRYFKIKVGDYESPVYDKGAS